MTTRRRVAAGVALVFFSMPALSAPSLYFTTAIKSGISAQQSTDARTIPNRTLLYAAGEGVLGIKWGFLILGAAAEYSLFRQLTDPAQVSGSNTQGKLLTVAPTLGIQVKSFRALVRFPLAPVADYKLDQPNLGGKPVAYSDAKTLSVQLHYQLSKHFFAGLEYQQLTFSTMRLDGAASALADADALVMRTYSLMCGFNL